MRLESTIEMPSPDAFAEIYTTYSRRVRGLCRQLLGSWDDAQDATGEVFLRLRTSLATYDESIPFDRWLLKVTANHCIDLLRRRRLERRWIKEDLDESPAASQSPSPLSALLDQEQRERLEKAVTALPIEYRLPLVLRYHAELGYDEIAKELGLERTQVAGRIFRAKHMLRRALI